MRAARIAWALSAVGLAALFAAAIWMRVTSLGAIPFHNGDESYEGTEVIRMLRGERFTLLSQSGNLLSPFFLATQAVFQAAIPGAPSVWGFRGPAMASGLLAVLLTYLLGRKVLGSSTALIASAVLIALPGAVYYGRMGHEYCQHPLFGVVALYFALKGRPWATVLTLVAALVAHPINLFLVPVALIVLAAQLAQKYWDNAKARRWMLIGAGVAMVLGGVFGALVYRRPIVQTTMKTRGPLDWLVFADGLANFSLFDYGTPPAEFAGHRNVFWIVVGLTAAVGLPRLVRTRRWDRLALIAGTVATLTAFHWVAGSTRLVESGTNRYGVVFLIPMVLSFACLFQAAFTPGAASEEEGSTRTAIARGAVAALGLAMLGLVAANWTRDYGMAGRGESVWTLRRDAPDPFETVYRTIRRDYLANEVLRGPCRIVGENFWIARPLEYYAAKHPIVRVEQVDQIPAPGWPTPKPTTFEGIVRNIHQSMMDRLREGAYVVTFQQGGFELAKIIRALAPADRLRTWNITNSAGQTLFQVHHLTPPPAVAAEVPPAPGSVVR